MGSSEIVQHMLKVALSGNGPIKVPKTDSRRYVADIKLNNNDVLPFLNVTKNTIATRATLSDPSLKAKQQKKAEDNYLAVNSAPTPVKVNHPSKHMRSSRKKAVKSSHLPILHTEAHGVPTLKQALSWPAESGNRWASSWAEVRATSLQRDEITSPLSSQPSPPVCRTVNNRKTVLPLTTDTGDSSDIPQSETRPTSNSGQNIDSKDFPCYTKSEIHRRKKKTTVKQTFKSDINVKRKPPPVERTKSKVGIFNQKGDFVLVDEVDPTKDLVRSKTFTNSQHRPAIVKTSIKSQSAKTIKERKNPKLRRRSVVITKKTLNHEKSLKSVYGNKSFKLQRHVSFVKQVSEVQRLLLKEENEAKEEISKRRIESVKNQRAELKQIRDRFDDEQVKRFGRQYVSWKSIETERLNRTSGEYGLPDDRYDKTLKDMSERTTTHRKPKSFHQFATWVKNIKRFESLLNPRVGTHLEKQLINRTKSMVEGIDIVELPATTNDLTKPAKMVKIERVIGSAKRLLNSQEMDAISEISSVDELQYDFGGINIEDMDEC